MILLLLLLLLPPAGAARAASVAGAVVRSKEWVVRRGAKREEEFIGDVRYDAAGTHLSADWALYRQTSKDWQVKGNVFARREFADGDAVETRGETAWYDQASQAGRIAPAAGGRVTVLRTPSQGGPDHAEGDRLTWEGRSAGVLAGRARGWGPRGEFWAETARYERRPTGQTLTLDGARPVAHNFEGAADAALKADRIVASSPPRRVSAEGRALGWILLQSSATRTSDGADRCGPGGRAAGPGPDERVTALLAPPPSEPPGAEESRFLEAQAAAFSARACPWGPRLDFAADSALYEESPDRRLTLSGGRPVLRKIDADWSTALKADKIVAVASSRSVAAGGRVKGWMVFKDEKKLQERKK